MGVDSGTVRPEPRDTAGPVKQGSLWVLQGAVLANVDNHFSRAREKRPCCEHRLTPAV